MKSSKQRSGPRKDYLGYVYYRQADDFEKGASNREQELAKIKISIAGYAAEKIVFGTVTTGVLVISNISWLTLIKWCGSWGWESPDCWAIFFPGVHKMESSLCRKTKEVLDNDVQDILQSCLKETMETLTKHRDVLDFFTQELLKKVIRSMTRSSLSSTATGLNPPAAPQKDLLPLMVRQAHHPPEQCRRPRRRASAMTKSHSLLGVFLLLLGLVVGCSKVTPPAPRPLSEAHQKFLKICQEEHKLKVVLKPAAQYFMDLRTVR